MKKKLFAAIGLVLVLGISPITSLAADELLRTEETVIKQEFEGVNQDKILELLKEVLDTEVSEGTITQTEADIKYKEIENGKLPPLGVSPNRDEFSNNNNLTKEEHNQKLKEMLDKNVEEGKLTQAEADEKYLAIQNGEKPEKPDGGEPPEKPEREENLDKPENMENQKAKLNDTERLALYYKILNYQVQNGYLTQTEADKKYEEMKEDTSKRINPPQTEK